jgi:hypothetical protein
MGERDDIHDKPPASGAPRRRRSMAPVLAGSEARVVERAQPPAVPAVPVVAAAASGAVVGAFVVFLLRVLRRPARRQPSAVRIGKRRGRRGTLEVTGSRSFLVDVHMLKR